MPCTVPQCGISVHLRSACALALVTCRASASPIRVRASSSLLWMLLARARPLRWVLPQEWFGLALGLEKVFVFDLTVLGLGLEEVS